MSALELNLRTHEQSLQSQACGLLVGVGVFLLCGIGILSRPGFDLATFWPANAFMLGLLVRYPQLSNRVTWLAGAAGFVLADAVTGSPLIKNIVLNTANLLAIAIGCMLFSRIGAQDRLLRGPLSTLYVLAVIAGTSLVAGVIGFIADPILFGGEAKSAFVFWFATEMVNYTAFLPMILTFPDLPRHKLRAIGAIFEGLRVQDILPVQFLALSVAASLVIGGPGAVAFPVPGLLWCALRYNIFSTACLTFCFGAWTLLSLRAGLLHAGIDLNERPALLSARVGVTLVSFAPLVVASVMSARADLLERLRVLANHDEMTGLRNRRSFMEEARSVLQTLPPGCAPIVVMMLDIDNFKTFNDRYGHAAGDEVLRAFARVLRRNVRPHDKVGRLGGEEFAVFLSGCSDAQASAIADRINSVFRMTPIELPSGEAVFATVSIGVHVAGNERCLDRLLGLADAALYRAKELGRNRFELSGLKASN